MSEDITNSLLIKKLKKEQRDRAITKCNAGNPPVPSRKARRKAWRNARVKTHTKQPEGMGTHAIRAEHWRATWKVVVETTKVNHGNRMRELFEAMFRPAKYLGEEEIK